MPATTRPAVGSADHQPKAALSPRPNSTAAAGHLEADAEPDFSGSEGATSVRTKRCSSLRRDAVAWRLADLLLRHPVVNRASIAEQIGVAPENTYRAIRPLEGAGIVREFSGRARNQMWQAPEVLEALDRFAARAGQRRRHGG